LLYWKEVALRTALSHLSMVSLAGLLAACGSNGNGQNPGGSGGSGGPGGSGGQGGWDAAVTSTSPGTGGISGSGGTSTGSGGTSTGSGGTSAGSGGTSAGSGGTSAGSGGTGAGTGGTGAGTGGAGTGGTSSVQGGAGGTSQTGGSGLADGGASTGGRPGDAAVDRGADGGGGSGDSADSGSIADAPADRGGTSGTCPGPTSYANLFVTVSGHTQAESDQKVSTAWSTLFNPSGSGTIYYNGPGADESYVQDIYNNDVRTEGMSYGMMTAVQLDHQTEFDRLWTWVKNHMAQGTGEIRWKCATSGSGCAGGGAPDGEEYMSTALIFASHRWGDSTGPGKIVYSTEAKWVLNVIRTKYFNSDYHLVKFVSSSNNVDPSYVLPAFYEVWACFDTENAAFWTEAATAGRAYMQKVVDSNGVCPYQASMTATNPQAANADSTRCPVNLMMDWYLFGKDTWQKDTWAPKFGSYSSSRNNGGAAVGCNSTLGFALPASSGKAFVDKLWSTAVPSHNYWDGVLYMLGMLHVSGNFHIW
jgi:oligosaccharide reducing-end xylanase